MTLLDRLVPTLGDVILNRYELVDELGRGGFGVVFRAKQRGLDEDVALKLLLPQLVVNPQVYQRFVREVQVAKRLRHPNSVRILDCGQTPEGLPFYAMEYVKGEPLDDVLKIVGRISATRTRHITAQILKSLAEAHSHGVVHRDLKPGNIMLCDIFGESDFVKVLDFGIAKALAEPGDTSHQTATGMILGTPAYMSPEQAVGHKEIDGRSDIYAAGLIMAECMLGQKVVKGETPFVLLAQHGSSQPLQFPPELKASPIWPIIDQATKKRREFRFRDATAMREALEGMGKLPTTDLMLGKPISDMVGPVDTPLVITPAEPASTEELLTSAAALTAHAHVGSGALPHEEKGHARLSYVLLLALFLAVIGAVGAVALISSSNRESTDTPGQAETSDPGLTTPNSQYGDSPDDRPGDQPSLGNAVTPGNVDRTHLAAMTMTVAIAADRLQQAVPNTHVVRFEGTDDVSVTRNGQLLGVTPFDGVLPIVDESMELHFERSGYRSSNATVSLLEDVIEVELRRRRSSRSGDSTTPDPDGEPPTTPSPFGNAPIDNR